MKKIQNKQSERIKKINDGLSQIRAVKRKDVKRLKNFINNKVSGILNEDYQPFKIAMMKVFRREFQAGNVSLQKFKSYLKDNNISLSSKYNIDDELLSKIEKSLAILQEYAVRSKSIYQRLSGMITNIRTYFQKKKDKPQKDNLPKNSLLVGAILAREKKLMKTNLLS